MSASISPRESKTKRAVQFASGGAAYDPDFVANGSKEDRIALIRDVNAKTAAKQAEASSASGGATTTLAADASASSAAPATPAAAAAAAATEVTPATAAGSAAASPAAAASGVAAAGTDDAARAAAAGAGGSAAGSATGSAAAAAGGAASKAATSRSGAPVEASTAAGTAAAASHAGVDASEGGGGAGKAAKIAAGVVAGVAVTGLVAFAASRLAARARQTALIDTLTRSFTDSSVCHLFVSPRTTLSPHRSPACTEAEAYLRLAKIAYTAHYVEHGSDLAGALARMDKTVQARVVRTWTAKGKTPSTQTPTTATPPPPPPSAAAGSDGGDRLSNEVQHDLSCLLEGGALPVLVYREEVICMGSRAIIDYCADAFNVKLDAVFSQDDRALGVSIRKQAAYSLPLFLRRTFNDHGKAWALVEGQQRGAAVPLLTGWYCVWKDRVCRAPMNYAIAHHTAIGAQSRVQYETAFQKEVMALEQTLGQKAFMLGFTPSSYDCAVYATLLPLMYVDEATVAGLNSAVTYIRSSEPLRAYMRRFSELVFPDIESLLKHATWMGRAGEEETFDYQTASAAAAPAASSNNARSVSMLSSPRETVNARAAEASGSRSVTPSASGTPAAKTRAAPLAPAPAPPASKNTAAIDDIDEL